MNKQPREQSNRRIMPKDIYPLITSKKKNREKFAVATVVETQGSASAKAGSKALINEDGLILFGWVGGGCAQSNVCEHAILSIEQNKTQILTIDLDDEMLGAGMPCGGNMTVFIEPILPKPIVWILGHGKVAETLCELANMMEFSVKIIDPAATWESFPHADLVINEDLDYEQLSPATEDFVVIATQHKGDHESLKIVLNTDVRYIGLIASNKRAGLIKAFLQEEGFEDSDIERVRTPCGVNLNPQTPQEIALSIVTEIVSIYRQPAAVTSHIKS